MVDAEFSKNDEQEQEDEIKQEGGHQAPNRGWRPDISSLADAIVFNAAGEADLSKVTKGCRLVVEYADQPHRDTCIAIVKEVKEDGLVWLSDEEWSRHVVTSADAVRAGKHIVKLAGQHTRRSLKVVHRRGRTATPTSFQTVTVTETNRKVQLKMTAETIAIIVDDNNDMDCGDRPSGVVAIATPINANTEARLASAVTSGTKRKGRPVGAIGDKMKADLISKFGSEAYGAMSPEQRSQAAREERMNVKLAATRAKVESGAPAGRRGRPVGSFSGKTYERAAALGLDLKEIKDPYERQVKVYELRARGVLK